MKIFFKYLLTLASVFLLAVSCAKKPSAGELVRGPDNSALVIEQYSDFYCTYCKEQAAILKRVFEEYPGKVRWTFRHFPLSGNPGEGSFPVHEAAMCASEQGKFWEFHDLVFISSQNTPPDEIAKILKLDLKKFQQCRESNRYRQAVQADLARGQKNQVMGTPTFFLGGEKMAGLRSFGFFAERLDPEFKKKADEQKRKAHEDLMKRINPSEDGRPVSGPVDAKLTIVEFSDFHCPFCAQLTDNLKKALEDYPGQVRRVWRHFPLPIHPAAAYAHLAAECAHEQGKFWEFHDKIFENQNKARKREDFERIASELALDAVQFKACYESPATKKKIENDVLLGYSQKIGSTPVLVINGEMFVGSKSAEELKKLIGGRLSQAESVSTKP